jgi:hypothetical protein
MANVFKTTSQQYVTHVPAGNNVKVVSSWFHNSSAMTNQTSSKTGRKRNDNIVDHFNIDPTSVIDDNVRQHKKPKSHPLTIAQNQMQLILAFHLKRKWRRLFPNHRCVIQIFNMFRKRSTCNPNKARLAHTQW